MKKKKISPIIKSNANYESWIISNFPENYQEMMYLEPVSTLSSIFLNKEVSNKEVLNNKDEIIIKILRTIRDDEKELSSKLKPIKCSLTTFQQEINGNSNNPVDQIVKELVLRKMSRSESKKIFKKIKKEQWDDFINFMPFVSQRLQKTYIVNKPTKEIVKVFNDKDVFCYFNPVDLKNTLPVNQEIMEILELFCSFKGKVIISGISHPIYKKIFKGWKNQTKKKTVVWHNY